MRRQFDHGGFIVFNESHVGEPAGMLERPIVYPARADTGKDDCPMGRAVEMDELLFSHGWRQEILEDVISPH